MELKDLKALVFDLMRQKEVIGAKISQGIQEIQRLENQPKEIEEKNEKEK